MTLKLAPQLTVRPVAQLQQRCTLYAELNVQLRAIEDAISEERALIRAIVEESGDDEIEIDNFRISMIRPVKKGKLDQVALLSAGVTPAQLAKGTLKDTKGTPYVKITSVDEESQ